MLSQRRMFHQDELVRNYLAQASQRYADQRVQHHRRSDELERVLSPKTGIGESRVSSAAKTAQVSQTLPAFERQNTLLLAGKSKFYTMSYEDHCRTPLPAVSRPSSSADHYCKTATDSLSAKTVASDVTDSRKSSSVGENLSHLGNTSSLCTAKHFTENSHSFPYYSDTNHNSIFSSYKAQCQGAENCPHPVLPQTGNVCAACFQAKRYSLVVHYPTAATKL